MRDGFFEHGIDPVLGCGQVCGFLGFEGLAFDGGVEEGEAGDAVEGCNAEVEGGGFGVVVGGGEGFGLIEEGGAGGEEGFGVGVGVAVVDVQLDWRGGG